MPSFNTSVGGLLTPSQMSWARTFGEGAAEMYGFERTHQLPRGVIGPTGPMKFLPKNRAAYAAATGKWWERAGKATWAAKLPLLAPVFSAYMIGSAFANEGIGGGVKEAATQAFFGGVFGVGGRAIREAGGMKAIGMRGIGFGMRAIPFLLPAATVYAANAMAQKAWLYHKQRLPLQTVGSMEAFTTSNAATMRQRSVQSIQRSYLNSRTAFGQEASFMALNSARGRKL